MQSPHPLRSILATSDLTDGSEPGLLSAAALAAATGSALHAFHCVPRPVFPYWPLPRDLVLERLVINGHRA